MNLKRILSLLLAAAMLCAMVGCTDQGGDATDGTDHLEAPKPVDTITEPDEIYVEGTLHKVAVTETDRAFVTSTESGTATQYAIVVDDHELNQEAATFIAKHVAAATGVTMELKSASDVSYSPSGKYIYLNCQEQFAAAGLTMPADDIGLRGYHIKSAGDSVFIMTKAATGAQLGAIAFLRHAVGYEIYSSDTVLYTKNGATLPDMDITERPDYDFYIPCNKLDNATTYAMGYQLQTDVFIRVTSETDSNGMYHNSMEYLPYLQYKDEHPDWYSDVSYGVEGQSELCYTAHGNEEEMEAMVNAVAERMLKEAAANPNLATITLTIEDHNTVCNCDACVASAKAYDESNAAAVIQFMNRVNRVVQAELQSQADAEGTDKRVLNILFFAYHKMLKAPARQNTQGQWEAIDESVICDPEVGVFYAPIEAYYNYSFYDEKNEEHKNNTEAWAACTDTIYMWTYCTNFGHYLFPYNTYDKMMENYRYFKNAGATFMFSQGQHNVTSPSHFSMFKEYLTSRALFNVNDNLADITDDFFAAYFKDAQQPMRQYYDELQAHLGYLAEAYPVQLNGYIREEIASLQYWPKETLQKWMGYIDEAYASIEKYKETDKELYEVLHKHILQESIFLRYALLELHFGSYHADELNTLRRQFKSDCEMLGINNISEWVPLTTVYSRWGIL